MNAKHILLLASLTTSCFAGAAADETIIHTKPAKDWWLTIAPYSWVTATDGDMGLAGRIAPVDISFKDTLETLDMAFMMAAEGGIGRWAFGIDGIYGAFSSDVDLPGPFARASVDFDQFFVRAHAGYQIIAEEDATLTAFVGARYSYLSSDFTLVGPFGRTFTASGSRSWVDPVIGMHGTCDINDRWFMHGGGDIGGFGVSSDLIWQVNAAVGYRWNDRVTFLAGYRAFGVDYSDGGFLVDTIAHGPTIGMTFQF